MQKFTYILFKFYVKIKSERGGKMKKIIMFFFVIYILISSTMSTFACDYHLYIPDFTYDKLVETHLFKYGESSTEEGTYFKLVYIMETSDYLLVVADDSLGVYTFRSEDIDYLGQDEENKSKIIVNFVDGTQYELDALNQEEYQENIYYFDYGLYMYVMKPEYEYLRTFPDDENEEEIIEIEEPEVEPKPIGYYLTLGFGLILILGTVAIFIFSSKSE